MSSSGESAAEPESGDTLLGELMSPQEMMDKTFPRRMVTTILPLMEQLQDREALLFRGIVVGSRVGRAGCAVWAEVDVSDSGHGLHGNRAGRTKYMNPAIVKSISVTRTSKVVGWDAVWLLHPSDLPYGCVAPENARFIYWDKCGEANFPLSRIKALCDFRSSIAPDESMLARGEDNHALPSLD